MDWEFVRREKETWWHIDEKNNALDYLEMSVRSLMEVERTPWAWKWVCIALHGALYGFGVCALQGTNYESVIENRMVFSWNKIPEADNEKLLKFLKINFGIDRGIPKIEKSEDDQIIKVSTGKNLILVKLVDKEVEQIIPFLENNDDGTSVFKTRRTKAIGKEVLLEIDGVSKTNKLIAKWRYNELIIYQNGTDRLLSFGEIIKRCQNKKFIMQGVISKPLVLNENQSKAIKFMKDELRNPLEHFIPRSWGLEIHGIPEMTASYFEIIEFLAGESGNLRWKDDEIARIKALCNSGKELALSTKLHWELSETT